MVSGFFTSPCDHWRIFSGDASEMRMALKESGSLGFSKKLKMSFTFTSFEVRPVSPGDTNDGVPDHERLNYAAAVPGFFGSAASTAGAFSISSTSRPSDWSSLISTLNDSGSPDSSEYSPLTMLSYIRVRPTTSSDLTVRNSCSEYAAP